MNISLIVIIFKKNTLDLFSSGTIHQWIHRTCDRNSKLFGDRFEFIRWRLCKPPRSMREWHRSDNNQLTWNSPPLKSWGLVRNKINLLTNSKPMAASRSFPRLRLERASGQEQIKTPRGRMRGTKAGAGDGASEGRIEGIGQELSTVASGGPSERIASGLKVGW